MSDLQKHLLPLIALACRFREVRKLFNHESHEQSNSYNTPEYNDAVSSNNAAGFILEDREVIRFAQVCGIGETPTTYRLGGVKRMGLSLELYLGIKNGLVVPSVLTDGVGVQLYQLLAEISMNIEQAPFNGDVLRQLWNDNQLNEAVEDARVHAGIPPGEFMVNHGLHNNDYQGLVTYLVKQNGGWPEEPNVVDSLTRNEERMVDTFDVDKYISAQVATWEDVHAPTMTQAIGAYHAEIIDQIHRYLRIDVVTGSVRSDVVKLWQFKHKTEEVPTAEQGLDFMNSWQNASVAEVLSFALHISMGHLMRRFASGETLVAVAKELRGYLQRLVKHGGTSNDLRVPFFEGCESATTMKVITAQEAVKLVAELDAMLKEPAPTED